ncbi:MAG: nucleoside phosphorylase [Thermotogaceae bacterium]|nr:nucleoside phosphorylase [Thermotogaceae bacterium]
MAEDPRYHIKVNPEDVGKYVIIVGDRGRVQRIAKYLANPVKVGDNREYLTMTGKLKGEKVSVMSTGMGAPAVEIAINELATTNAKVVIRLGTTGALQKFLKLGDTVIATATVRRDGATIQYLPPEFPAVADFYVTNYLVKAAQESGHRFHTGIVYSTDSYYGKIFNPESHQKYIELLVKARVLTVEMELGSLFVVGKVKNLKTGGILVVREEIGENSEYIQAGEKFEEGMEKTIQIALRAIEMMIDEGL